MNIGTRVTAARDIVEPADEYGPLRLLARRGESLIIRGSSKHWFALVSHEHITDNSFGVKEDELSVALSVDAGLLADTVIALLDAGKIKLEDVP